MDSDFAYRKKRPAVLAAGRFREREEEGHMKRLCLCLLVLGLMPSAALAADKKQQAAQEISFEEDTVTGDLTKPDGEYVEARRKIEHTSLIRVREEFQNEVLQSVSDL